MDLLNYLFFIYATALGINSLIAAVLWYQYKSRVFRLAFKVWAFSVLNLFLYTAFESANVWMALSFLTYFPVALSLTLIYQEISPTPRLPDRKYIIAALGGAALTGLTSLAGTVLGFSLVLIVTFAFSIIIPVFALRLNDQLRAQKLEAKVNERTKELKVANQQLQEALSQNDNLLNIVCHDIASPLMIAKLNIEKLLLKTSDSSEDLRAVSKSLQKIKLSTLTMQEVLEQVRKLHIIDLKHSQMELAPVDIHQTILEVFKLLEDRMEEKSLGLEIIIPSGKPYFVNAEKSVLQNNVFLNLVTNAIKFSHPGGNIQVRIGEIGENISITIKDEGIGIPKDMQSKIFEIKSKTSRYGTSGEVGTGLGLPIVKRCLEHFHATIHCLSTEADASTPTHGTEFEIRFPKVS